MDEIPILFNRWFLKKKYLVAWHNHLPQFIVILFGRHNQVSFILEDAAIRWNSTSRSLEIFWVQSGWRRSQLIKVCSVIYGPRVEIAVELRYDGPCATQLDMTNCSDIPYHHLLTFILPKSVHTWLYHFVSYVGTKISYYLKRDLK